MSICQIDWGAWATFSNSVAALAAAFFVARFQFKIWRRQAAILSRQTKILNRQSSIADRQARTDEARIRWEMFDKRYEFVQTLDAFVKRVKSNRELWTSEDAQFLEGARRAQLLFPKSLKPIIDKLWDIATDYQASTEELGKGTKEQRAEVGEKRKRLRLELNDTLTEFNVLLDREARPFKD